MFGDVLLTSMVLYTYLLLLHENGLRLRLVLNLSLLKLYFLFSYLS